jgi:hypothetical protein
MTQQTPSNSHYIYTVHTRGPDTEDRVNKCEIKQEYRIEVAIIITKAKGVLCRQESSIPDALPVLFLFPNQFAWN